MKRQVRFGTDFRRAITGGDLYVLIFQITALLPLPYILAASAYPAILGTRNPLSVLFDIGISAIPRAEAFALSSLYRTTSNEMVVFFVLPVIALILGKAAENLFQGAPGRALLARRIMMALIACDLVIRLIPVKANRARGIPAAIAGFAVRAACLWLVWMDIRACRKAADEANGEVL